jgi:hypothetical protein
MEQNPSCETDTCLAGQDIPWLLVESEDSLIIIIIIGSTALCGPWPSSEASASLLYPG